MNPTIQQFYDQVTDINHQIANLENMREEMFRRIDEEVDKLELAQKSLFEAENVSDGQYEAL